LETDALLASARLAGGYAQSRWVAEKILQLAGQRGLPVGIYRPGLLVGEGEQAAVNEGDISWRVLKACVEIRAVPAGSFDVFLTPAAYVRGALVHLSRLPASAGKTFHLVNPRRQTLGELIGHARAFGYDVETVSKEEWEERLSSADLGLRDNPLLPYLLILSGEVHEEFRRMPGFVPVDCRNTLAGLEGSGLACPPVDRVLMENCFRQFIRAGLWPSPEQQRAKAALAGVPA
jgi:thioester reductase-like protein